MPRLPIDHLLILGSLHEPLRSLSRHRLYNFLSLDMQDVKRGQLWCAWNFLSFFNCAYMFTRWRLKLFNCVWLKSCEYLHLLACSLLNPFHEICYFYMRILQASNLDGHRWDYPLNCIASGLCIRSLEVSYGSGCLPWLYIPSCHVHLWLTWNARHRADSCEQAASCHGLITV